MQEPFGAQFLGNRPYYTTDFEDSYYPLEKNGRFFFFFLIEMAYKIGIFHKYLSTISFDGKTFYYNVIVD